MPVLLVIPARVASTRLPSKPLRLLGGAPLVARVVERAQQVPGIDRLVVATDSAVVAGALEATQAEVAMTGDCASGTDRVAEVAGRPEFAGYDVVINFQGDEPFLPVAAVTGALRRVAAGDALGTAAAPLDPSLRDDPARVKVVCDAAGRALYFSRSPIPYLRDASDASWARWWQHLGVYAYRRDALLRLTGLPPSPLERVERLEQLRALEAGMRIDVELIDAEPLGVDTPADLEKARRILAGKPHA